MATKHFIHITAKTAFELACLRFVRLQELPEANAAAERHKNHPKELCGVSEAQELAVVATVYQGKNTMLDFIMSGFDLVTHILYDL